MTTTLPKNSIWALSGHVPPRGRCNHKVSLLSSSCPCLRFMLHPVKAATSFECDGCSHHASFHSLENPAEDAVLKKWAAQEASSRETAAQGGKKRKRIADRAASKDASLVEIFEDAAAAGAEKSEAKAEKSRSRLKVNRGFPT